MATVGPPKHPRPDPEPVRRELVQTRRPAVAPDGEDLTQYGPESAWGGVGMAVYAVLLIVLGVGGCVGMIGATYGLIMSTSSRYSELKSGTEVAVWRTQPLRDAGLIGVGDVPLAWHDESQALDGTIACATTPEALLWVSPQGSATLAYSAMSDVQTQGTETDGVTVTAAGDGTTIRCTFGPQEGGERFGRQLRVAAGLPQP